MNCLYKNKPGADILAEHLLEEYGAGTLDPVRRAELDRHVEECAECRGLLEVWNRLDGFEAPAVSENFDQRLYARIAAEKQLPWWRRILLPSATVWRPSWRHLWRPALPLAAACAVLVLALMVRDPDATSNATKTATDPVKQATVEPVKNSDVDQLVQALDDLELLSPVTQSSSGAI
jgi:anti-sigma-K factor RskA